MKLKTVYLVMAILGAVIPIYFFLQHFDQSGFSLTGFLAAAYANPAAAGLTTDLFISSFVFWILMFQLQRRDRGPGPLPFIVVNLLIGLSCALPAYLYVRESRGPDSAKGVTGGPTG